MLESNDIFRRCAKKLRVLDSLAWEGKVAAEFFRKKESVLPKPTYKIDRAVILLQIESKRFHDISVEIYGQPLSKPFNGETTNLDLANAVSKRISMGNFADIRGASLYPLVAR